MSHQDRREPLPADYQYQPWRRVSREMLTCESSYCLMPETAEQQLEFLASEVLASARMKGLDVIGTPPLPIGAHLARVVNGVRLIVVYSPEHAGWISQAAVIAEKSTTHGVDCDCPPCRNRVTETDSWWYWDGNLLIRSYGGVMTFDQPTQTAYGWGV